MLRIALFALLFLLPFGPSAHAWGKYGHVTVCEIAYRLSTPNARDELNRLMKFHEDDTSFNRACLFADRNPRKRPKEHYVNYSRDLESVTHDGCGDKPKCVISAINSDFGILANSSNSNSDRARAMVLLGHWVGDIHQPLHVSFADDRGGNGIKKRGRCSARNLHAVWDNCIVELGVFARNGNHGPSWWRRYTNAYRAADRLIAETDLAEISTYRNSEPWQWAAESFNVVRIESIGYCTLMGGSCWYEESRKTLEPDGEIRVFQNTQNYIDAHTDIADEQLLKAGVRLAHLLSEALDPDYSP